MQRADSIGIDENNYPVIFEYKLKMNPRVINQSLSYLEYIINHKHEFDLIVHKHFNSFNLKINWQKTRLICIAEEFAQWDFSVINWVRLNKNIVIELYKYKKYTNPNVLILESLRLVSQNRWFFTNSQILPLVSFMNH